MLTRLLARAGAAFVSCRSFSTKTSPDAFSRASAFQANRHPSLAPARRTYAIRSKRSSESPTRPATARVCEVVPLGLPQRSGPQVWCSELRSVLEASVPDLDHFGPLSAPRCPSSDRNCTYRAIRRRSLLGSSGTSGALLASRGLLHDQLLLETGLNSHLLAILDELWSFGLEHDARQAEHAQRMLNVTPEGGRFLWTLVMATRARRVLEIGTSNGYSTLWLADAARANRGRIISVEEDPSKVSMARENLARAELSPFVELVNSPACEALQGLSGPFHFVFLDADRASYPRYLAQLLPVLGPRALIVADNAVSHAAELDAYLRRVKSDPMLFSLTVPVGKGEELSIKLD